MILEVSQILDGGTRPIMTNLKPNGGPYEIVKIPATHRDNPVIHSARTKWVFEWALAHLDGLLAAFRARWGHDHAYAKNRVRAALRARYDVVAPHLDNRGLYLAMDADVLAVIKKLYPMTTRNLRSYATLPVAVAAHRLNYAATKLTYAHGTKPATWTGNAPPPWLRSMARSHGYELVLSDDGRRYRFDKRKP
jgi:hypothetical protein